MDFEELRERCIRQMRLRVQRDGPDARVPSVEMLHAACHGNGADALLLALDLHAVRRAMLRERAAA